jgi:hypothetical protein
VTYVTESANKLAEAGYSSGEVDAWVAEQHDSLLDAGYSPEEAGIEIGKPMPDEEEFQKLFTGRWAMLTEAARDIQPKEGKAPEEPLFSFDDFGQPEPTQPNPLHPILDPNGLTAIQSVAYGAKNLSVSGMTYRKITTGSARPEHFSPNIDPESIDIPTKALISLGAVGVDLPWFRVGGMIARGLGYGAIGQGAAAFGLVAAGRTVLIDNYVKGTIDNPEEYLSAYMSAIRGLLPEAGLGGVLAAVAGPLSKVGASPLTILAAEIATLEAGSAVINQEIPTLDEIVETSFMILGLKAGVGAGAAAGRTAKRGALYIGQREVLRHQGVKLGILKPNSPSQPVVTGRLSKIYVEDNKHPGEVLDDAAVDPSIREDLNSLNIEKPRSYSPEVKDAERVEPPEPIEAVSPEQAAKANEPPRPFGPDETLRDVDRDTLGVKDPEAHAREAQRLMDELDPPVPEGDGPKPPRNLVRERIGKHEGPPGLWSRMFSEDAITEGAAKFYTNWLDRLFPRNRFVREVMKNRPAPVEDIVETTGPKLDRVVGKKLLDKPKLPIITEDPYWLERLFAGNHAKATSVVTDGALRWSDYKRMSKGIPEILRPLGDGKEGFARQGELEDYLVARYAVELKERGTKRVYGKDPVTGKKTVTIEDKFKTGVPIEDVIGENGELVGRGAKWIRDNAKPEIVKVADGLREYQNEVLRYLKDSGAISQEAFAAMIETNMFFTPLNRVVEAEYRTAAALKNASTPIFKMRGSEELIISPLESMIKNTYLFTAFADRAQINRSFWNMVQEHPEGESIAVEVKPTIKQIQLDAREIAKFVEKYNDVSGGDATAKDIKEASKEVEGFVDIFRPQPVHLGKNQIYVFEDGKRKVIEIKDPDLFRTWQPGATMPDSKLLRALQFPAKWLRAGAVSSPNFQVVNPIRDSIFAFVVTEDGFVPVVDTFRGLFSMARTKISPETDMIQSWKKFQTSGGPMATLQSMDRKYYESSVKEMFYDTHLIKNYRNVVNPLALLQLISSGSETMTRLGVFKRSGGDTAMTKEELFHAGKEAREVMDFQRKGQLAQYLNMYSAFFAVGMQGPDRLVRAFKDRPVATATRVFTGIVLPTTALYLLNKDREWFKEISDHERNLFLHFALGDQDNPIAIMRMPRGHEVGLVFGRGAERTVDYILNEDPGAFDDFFSDIMVQVAPNPLPQPVMPPLEAVTNWDFFRKRPLLSMGMERVMPELQFTPYTTELTKALGALIREIPGIDSVTGRAGSPVVIDNFIGKWTGGTGKLALRLLDAASRKAGIIPEGTVKPATEMTDIPGIGALFLRENTLSKQPVIDFFENMKRADKIRSTIDAYDDLEGGLEAQEALERRFGPMDAAPDDIRREIGEANKMLRELHNYNDMPPAEKQQLQEEIVREIVEASKEGNLVFDDIEEELKYFEEQNQ